MSDAKKPPSHYSPPRYKSSARPWCDIPGHCGYYTGEPPKKHPCTQPATHRCRGLDSEHRPIRYGWLCDAHAASVRGAGKIIPDDDPLLKAGRTCDVWKCQRRAARWTHDGYAICNACAGN